MTRVDNLEAGGYMKHDKGLMMYEEIRYTMEKDSSSLGNPSMEVLGEPHIIRKGESVT